MKLALVISAALATAVVATPASAGANKARVSYADLNLTTVDGQAELQERLDKATRRVCRFDENGMVVSSERENACYRVSRKEAAVRMAELVRDQQYGG